MPDYDPFARGPHAAAVVTVELERGERRLPVELWYPASEGYADLDLNEATRDSYEILPGLPAVFQDAVRDASPRKGKFPLVAFSHGYGGHRRQSTFLCTHLASHGYVVAAVDHTGNTVQNVLEAVVAQQSGRPFTDPFTVLRQYAELRPGDVSFMIDRVLDDAGELAANIDPERIGMMGHSFGGWTTLAVTGRDPRIRAALPLAPAGGTNPITTPNTFSLDFRWGRDVPTLFIVADRDTLLPLAGMRELYAQTQSTKRMVVLRNTDHLHFCDRVEEQHEMFRTLPPDPLFKEIQASIPPITEFCAGSDAQLAVRVLGLAHMDAHLKGDESAARFLAGDLPATLATHGVTIDVTS